jgi:AraC family transcriptional regulator of adaptative response/methylated-DNA-[protein]-cysteine methyltransferase
LEASFELGLSGPGRLHDLFVVHEAMSPGEWKTGGAGMTISYGFHPSPFGTALVLSTERGLCGLAFADNSERAALDDMRGRWPNARLVENKAQTLGYARRVFEPGLWREDQPLRIVLIGTDFEVRVWETLLTIRSAARPMERSRQSAGLAARAARRSGNRSRSWCRATADRRQWRVTAITGADAHARCSAGRGRASG